jgi:hypothetical protein
MNRLLMPTTAPPNTRMEPTAPGVALKIERYLKDAFPIYECLRTGAAADATRSVAGGHFPPYRRGGYVGDAGRWQQAGAVSVARWRSANGMARPEGGGTATVARDRLGGQSRRALCKRPALLVPAPAVVARGK